MAECNDNKEQHNGIMGINETQQNDHKQDVDHDGKPKISQYKETINWTQKTDIAVENEKDRWYLLINVASSFDTEIYL